MSTINLLAAIARKSRELQLAISNNDVEAIEILEDELYDLETDLEQTEEDERSKYDWV